MEQYNKNISILDLIEKTIDPNKKEQDEIEKLKCVRIWLVLQLILKFAIWPSSIMR